MAYSTVFLDTPLDPKKRKRCAFIVVGGGGSADVVAVKLYFFVVHLFEVAVKLYFVVPVWGLGRLNWVMILMILQSVAIVDV